LLPPYFSTFDVHPQKVKPTHPGIVVVGLLVVATPRMRGEDRKVFDNLDVVEV
jgi:hypothetical protein